MVALAYLASLLGPAASPTPLAPSTVASAGRASTEHRALAADLRDRVASGVEVAAGRVDVAPFDLLGVSWASGTGVPVRVRVHHAGAWSEWRTLEAEGDDGPDAGSAESGPARVVSQPLWVAGADGYEVETPGDATEVAVHLVRDRPSPASGRVVLAASGGKASSGAPAISSRSSWSARPPTTAPIIASQLKMAFVHHTVSSNDYAAADVPAMLRGIQAYHMDVNGWDDIGYNFLVDRFGTIWEGREGGTTRNVVGAHAVGFNTSSVGVAVLGEFTTASPTSASVSAVGRLLGWRLGLAGVDPRGRATMPSGDSTRTFAAVSGHRDADATACPGAQLYARLGAIRDRAAGDSPPASPPVDIDAACPPGRVPEGGFVDVGASNVHHVAVDCLAWYGVTAGGPAGLPPDRFGPELRVRRGQMATFLVRVLDRVDPGLAAPADIGFPCPSDPSLAVAADHPHADAIRRLAGAGVVAGGVGGTPPDCFGPELEVRRDQMASFLHRALELASGQPMDPGDDAFDDDGGNPHEAAIDALAARGVVSGTGSGDYDPSSPVRRDQMASFLVRQLGVLVDAGRTFPPA